MGRRVVGAGSIEPPPFNPRNQIGARQLTDVPTCFFYKLSPLFCGWKNGGLSSRATLMDKELIVKCVINGRLRQSPQCLVCPLRTLSQHSTLLPSAFLFPGRSCFCFKSLRCKVGFKLRISLSYTQIILCWGHWGEVIKASVIGQWKLIVAIGADFISTRNSNINDNSQATTKILVFPTISRLHVIGVVSTVITA